MLSLMAKIKSIKEISHLNRVISNTYNLIGVTSKKVKGSNNTINYSGSYLKKIKIEIIGHNNEIEIKNLSRLINCSIIIRGSGHKLIIDEKNYITNTDFSFVQDEGTIKLGKRNHIGGIKMLSGESKMISIGDDCLFSSNIEIRTTDSHSILSLETKQRINIAKDVIVRNNIWIGNSSRLWKGTIIDDNCVVGYGSMTNGHIPSNCLAVGTPAKVLKENIVWDKELKTVL